MSNMDMQTTVYCYGSPEMALLSAGYTDITKWLRVPEYETAGCSDAKCFDEQAAMEATHQHRHRGAGRRQHDPRRRLHRAGPVTSSHMLVASDEIISRTSASCAASRWTMTPWRWT